MKFITLIFCTLIMCSPILGQIKGNTKTVREHVSLGEVRSVYIGLYADIVIDAGADSAYIDITAEENLLSYIERGIKNDTLILNQKEWIQPRRKIVIRLGLPHLSEVIQSTHETVVVQRVKGAYFRAQADVGTIRLEGEADALEAVSGVGEVDAQDFKTQEVSVALSSWGTISLQAPETIAGRIEGRGKVVYQGNPETRNLKIGDNGQFINRSEPPVEKEVSTDFISFRIKNNSWKRLEAYVVGPKANGKYFSYGFPMRPGQVRKEKWTIGTKVYRKTSLGIKKLLVEIKASDEGGVVLLHDKEK